MAKKNKNINTDEQKQEYKEGNAFDNPFKSLDKSNFRSDNRKEPKNIVKKPVYQEKDLPSNDSFENEEEYFLFAMSNVNSVKNKEKYAQKKENTLEHKISQNSFDKEVSNKANDKKTLNPLFNEDISKKLQKSKEEKQDIANNLKDSMSQNIQTFTKNKQKEATQVKHGMQSAQTQTKPEDNEFFDFFSAVSDVKPLDGKERITPPEPKKIIVQQDQTPLLHDFEEGKLEFSLSANEEHVQCNILGLDILTLGKLQNRHYNPEASIDLHGLKANEAFHTLIPFFKNAYYRDMRCVLIVTGKGLNSFDNKPLLRTKITEWLIDAPFKYITLAFCTAKKEDGGSGALYVLLRKRRKNSPEIPWDRIPNDYDIWADLDK